MIPSYSLREDYENSNIVRSEHLTMSGFAEFVVTETMFFENE